MNMIRLPFVFVLLLPAAEGPVPKFPLGKETTYVTGPLTKEGYIDYLAALNDRLSKGITPEKNAEVLLVQAFGPRPEGVRLPAEFYKRLGSEEPPERGDYFLSLESYGKKQLKLDEKKLNTLFDQHYHASNRIWRGKDYPDLEGWLRVNEKPLALIIQATRRPKYYNPLVPGEKCPSTVVGASMPRVRKCGEVSGALVARALLRAGEGKLDDAWNDLLACHRLGRLVARGGTLIEGLVGMATDRVASYGDLAYLESPNVSVPQIRRNLNDLQALPPLAPMVEKMDLAERFMILDCLQVFRRDGVHQFKALVDGSKPKKLGPGELKLLEAIAWEPALRMVNQFFDRVVSAMEIKDRAQREQVLDRIAQDVKVLSKKAGNLTDALATVFGSTDSHEKAGKKIGEILIALLLPAFTKVQHAVDRDEQVHCNLDVAFALAAYQREQGRYPAKLDVLIPRFLSAIPNDLFSGKALLYRPSANGYLLYSVGVNGQDEGGRNEDDNPPGDDLSVRMPLPDLKPFRP